MQTFVWMQPAQPPFEPVFLMIDIQTGPSVYRPGPLQCQTRSSCSCDLVRDQVFGIRLDKKREEYGDMSPLFCHGLAKEIHVKGVSAAFWECQHKCNVGTLARSIVLATTVLINLCLPRKGWWQQAAGVAWPNLLQWSHWASSIGVATLAPSTGGSLAQDIKQKSRRGMQMHFFFSIVGVYSRERYPNWHFSCNTLWLVYSSPNFSTYLALNTPKCMYIYHSS